MTGPRERSRVWDDQIAYYRRRASGFDEWYERTARYDRGAPNKEAWFSELDVVTRWIEGLPWGDTLELAAGTGRWTQLIAGHATQLTALDVAPEMLAIARARPGTEEVDWVCADVAEWEPTGRFDHIFFGFWLSHVPASLFESFWQRLGQWLNPTGCVRLLDSVYNPLSTANDRTLGDPDEGVVVRRLNDGTEFSIIKVFYEPDTLRDRLGRIDWHVDAHRTSEYFLYGEARPA
jgi:demethylmenaquinone methyltransferase/2-methoxy-6-polyprenyl-1,4-benzoquinol methylase